MISVIIPTLNAGNTLRTLMAQLGGEVDHIIVSDGGSNDDTISIAVKFKASLVLGHQGRGHQLARGARWSKHKNNNWLLFLHADSRLSPDWHKQVSHHISQYPEKAGYFDLKFDSSRLPARLVEIFVKARCKLFALPYGDQGLLISRDMYEAVGGFAPQPLFEDVALIKTLGSKRIRRLGTHIVTNSAKYDRDGFFRRGLRNLRLLARYMSGEDPDQLAKDYQ